MSRLTPEIVEALSQPFPAKKVQWRQNERREGKAQALAYIEARDVMQRLDEVLAGVVGFSGRAVRLTARALSGTLSAEGGTQDRWAKALPRTWDGLSGALSRRITALRRGAIALAGSARRYSTTLRSVPRSELTLAPRSTSLTLPNRRPEDR